MQLAQVIGTVVATRKQETLIGFKLLVLEVEAEAKLRLVAVDRLGAGVGDTVLYVTGGAARVDLPPHTPVDAAIVGIVDSVDVRS
ncbi:MAG: EutN/CcmL family microcompartment protein [Phyllobacteriaceae bacterium]|nr:EutN/CcmL family microcompartment protein [Phyllobacteriaceae bacterium]